VVFKGVIGSVRVFWIVLAVFYLALGVQSYRKYKEYARRWKIEWGSGELLFGGPRRHLQNYTTFVANYLKEVMMMHFFGFGCASIAAAIDAVL